MGSSRFGMHAKRLYAVCESLGEAVVEYVEFVVMVDWIFKGAFSVLLSSFWFIGLSTLESRPV